MNIQYFMYPLAECSLSLNDVVSIETAKKLKESGFPSPQPAFGQIWMTTKDILFGFDRIIEVIADSKITLHLQNRYFDSEVKNGNHALDINNATFLPNGDDIRFEIKDKEKADELVEITEVEIDKLISSKQRWSRHEIYANFWLEENKKSQN